MIKKIKAAVKCRRGYTMVELIVTFALLAMFSVAVLHVIGSSMNIFESAKTRANAQSVSATLMEKITGEIGGAQPGTKNEYSLTIIDAAKNPGGGYLAYDTGSCISFCSRTGSQIYITVENDYLLVHYRPVNDNDSQLHAVDWTFDKAVYNGFVIDELKFSIMEKDGEASNVIKVSLVLRNERTGETYDSVEYAQCYNFDTPLSLEKITYDAIKADET